MPISTTDGSKTLYTFFPETVAGTPAVGAYQTVRAKAGVKFDLARATFGSNELRNDGMEGALTYGTKSGTWSIPIEWSYGTYDALLEAAFQGTWAADILVMGQTKKTFSFEETASELGIVEVIEGAQVGSFSISRKVDGVAEGDISGIFRNTKVAQTVGVNIAVDATAKTITRATAGFNTIDGFPLVTAGVPVLKVSMQGNTDAGNNNNVWTVTTLTDTVMTMTTMTGAVTKVTTAGITVNLASNATSVVAATTIAPFDSFTGTITEGGTVIAHVTGWDLKADRELKANMALGSDSAQSVSAGTIKISGNLTVYYVDQSLRKKFINGKSSTLALMLGSVAATKAYKMEMNTVSYTSNSRDHSPLARIESLAFVATYTLADLSSLKITRTP